MRALWVALIFTLSAGAAQAQTREDLAANMGLTTCATWLSSRAQERDGESWFYGFWSGVIQAAPLVCPDAAFRPELNPNNIGPRPDVDLMLAEMHAICRAEPASTLVSAALRVVEMSRQGMFTAPPPKP